MNDREDGHKPPPNMDDDDDDDNDSRSSSHSLSDVEESVIFGFSNNLSNTLDELSSLLDEPGLRDGVVDDDDDDCSTSSPAGAPSRMVGGGEEFRARDFDVSSDSDSASVHLSSDETSPLPPAGTEPSATPHTWPWEVEFMHPELLPLPPGHASPSPLVAPSPHRRLDARSWPTAPQPSYDYNNADLPPAALGSAQLVTLPPLPPSSLSASSSSAASSLSQLLVVATPCHITPPPRPVRAPSKVFSSAASSAASAPPPPSPLRLPSIVLQCFASGSSASAPVTFALDVPFPRPSSSSSPPSSSTVGAATATATASALKPNQQLKAYLPSLKICTPVGVDGGGDSDDDAAGTEDADETPPLLTFESLVSVSLVPLCSSPVRPAMQTAAETGKNDDAPGDPEVLHMLERMNAIFGVESDIASALPPSASSSSSLPNPPTALLVVLVAKGPDGACTVFKLDVLPALLDEVYQQQQLRRRNNSSGGDAATAAAGASYSAVAASRSAATGTPGAATPTPTPQTVATPSSQLSKTMSLIKDTVLRYSFLTPTEPPVEWFLPQSGASLSTVPSSDDNSDFMAAPWREVAVTPDDAIWGIDLYAAAVGAKKRQQGTGSSAGATDEADPSSPSAIFQALAVLHDSLFTRTNVTSVFPVPDSSLLLVAGAYSAYSTPPSSFFGSSQPPSSSLGFVSVVDLLSQRELRCIYLPQVPNSVHYASLPFGGLAIVRYERKNGGSSERRRRASSAQAIRREPGFAVIKIHEVEGRARKMRLYVPYVLRLTEHFEEEDVDDDTDGDHDETEGGDEGEEDHVLRRRAGFANDENVADECEQAVAFHVQASDELYGNEISLVAVSVEDVDKYSIVRASARVQAKGCVAKILDATRSKVGGESVRNEEEVEKPFFFMISNPPSSHGTGAHSLISDGRSLLLISGASSTSLATTSCDTSKDNERGVSNLLVAAGLPIRYNNKLHMNNSGNSRGASSKVLTACLILQSRTSNKMTTAVIEQPPTRFLTVHERSFRPYKVEVAMEYLIARGGSGNARRYLDAVKLGIDTLSASVESGNEDNSLFVLCEAREWIANKVVFAFLRLLKLKFDADAASGALLPQMRDFFLENLDYAVDGVIALLASAIRADEVEGVSFDTVADMMMCVSKARDSLERVCEIAFSCGAVRRLGGRDLSKLSSALLKHSGGCSGGENLVGIILSAARWDELSTGAKIALCRTRNERDEYVFLSQLAVRKWIATVLENTIVTRNWGVVAEGRDHDIYSMGQEKDKKVDVLCYDDANSDFDGGRDRSRSSMSVDDSREGRIALADNYFSQWLIEICVGAMSSGKLLLMSDTEEGVAGRFGSERNLEITDASTEKAADDGRSGRAQSSFSFNSMSAALNSFIEREIAPMSAARSLISQLPPDAPMTIVLSALLLLSLSQIHRSVVALHTVEDMRQHRTPLRFLISACCQALPRSERAAAARLCALADNLAACGDVIGGEEGTTIKCADVLRRAVCGAGGAATMSVEEAEDLVEGRTEKCMSLEVNNFVEGELLISEEQLLAILLSTVLNMQTYGEFASRGRSAIASGRMVMRSWKILGGRDHIIGELVESKWCTKLGAAGMCRVLMEKSWGKCDRDEDASFNDENVEPGREIKRLADAINFDKMVLVSIVGKGMGLKEAVARR